MIVESLSCFLKAVKGYKTLCRRL